MSDSTDTLRLLPASSGDVAFIAELARDQIERGLRWTWRPLRIARTLARSDALGVVAALDGAPAGFCLANYGTQKLHILLLGVDPDARRMGIGRRLVAWHEKCAVVAGLTSVTLELRASNHGARRFYESLDFHVAARHRDYYQGREDALLMHKRLVVARPLP
jgi:ribosomal protein S18 acetylase RimI-like enzyme